MIAYIILGKMVREILKQEIKKALGPPPPKADGGEVDFSVEVPNNPEHGDYSSNVALILGEKNVAEKIKSELGKSDLIKKHFSRIEIAGPGFLNFWLSKEYLYKTLQEIIQKKEKFGQGRKKKETIVIEYSSPNIAKPLGVHHLRSTIIGQALVNILRFNGYKVVSLSFPGDWGTQFGILIAGYKRWGDKNKLKQNPISEMLELYVRFSKAAKESPELKEEGRREFKKLEEGDKENLKLWKWFLAESMKDFNRVYDLLEVKIENTIGESFYEPKLKGLIQSALEQGIAKKGEDGSVVIVFKNYPPELIQKSDGATLFTTRELAAIRHRMEKWKAQKIIYAADNGQSFHLEQVFRAAELLGFAKKEQLVHVKFGVMLGPDKKKFATREGKLIPLEEVLKEAIERARKVVEELNPVLTEEEKNKAAKIVGIGAVKFSDLHQNRVSDIVFDWDKMLNLKGGSAPYIQYTYARLKSILRKAGKRPKKFNFHFLKEEKELDVLRELVHFPEVVIAAGESYLPNLLAEYVLHLAEKLNVFYESHPVLKAEEPVRQSRLGLISAGAIILSLGLKILGISVPERM